MSVQLDTAMRAWFEEVWNQGREETIYRLLAADGVAHGLPGGVVRGPDAFRSHFQVFRGAFPDIHVDVERTLTDGEFVVAHCHVTGTHLGDSLGIPPTGRRIDFEGVTIVRMADGLFREGWNFFDFLKMYQQLGVVPPIPGS